MEEKSLAQAMDAKLLVQLDNFNKIFNARRNFKKSPKERITEVYVKVRLEALENLWSIFVNAHQALLENFGANLGGKDYIEKDFYDQAQECYLEFKTELKSLIEKFCKKIDDAGNNQGKKSTSHTPIELPKIAIPKFSGKYIEWITFRDLFISLIHNNANLDNVQKMHYLKSSLIGEAEQLLRQIPISDANYSRLAFRPRLRPRDLHIVAFH